MRSEHSITLRFPEVLTPLYPELTALFDDGFVCLCARYEAFSSWLSDESLFKGYLDEDTQHAPNSTVFYQWLHYYLDSPSGKAFKDHVVFGENGIRSTRFTAFTKEIKDGAFAVATVENVRNAASTAAPVFEPIAYTLTFLFYDGFKVIAWETVRNVVMAGGAVFVILTTILANMQMALIVTTMIALTDVMLFGEYSSSSCS